MFVLVERILSALMKNFVTYCIFADLALKRLVTVVETMRSLISYCFAPKPTLEALKMDKLDSSHTEANIEEGIASGLY